MRRMRYRVEGPFVRADLPERVLFLIIIGIMLYTDAFSRLAMLFF